MTRDGGRLEDGRDRFYLIGLRGDLSEGRDNARIELSSAELHKDAASDGYIGAHRLRDGVGEGPVEGERQYDFGEESHDLEEISHVDIPGGGSGG